MTGQHPAHRPHSDLVQWFVVWHDVGHHVPCAPHLGCEPKPHPFYEIALVMGKDNTRAFIDREVYGPLSDLRYLDTGKSVPEWLSVQVRYATLAALSRIQAWLSDGAISGEASHYGIRGYRAHDIRTVNARITKGLLDGTHI